MDPSSTDVCLPACCRVCREKERASRGEQKAKEREEREEREKQVRAPPLLHPASLSPACAYLCMPWHRPAAQLPSPAPCASSLPSLLLVWRLLPPASLPVCSG